MARAQAAAVLLEGVVQPPVQAILDAPGPGGTEGHGQVGNVVANGPRGAAAQGPFGDHAHGTAQGRPAAVRIEFVPEAVGHGTGQSGLHFANRLPDRPVAKHASRGPVPRSRRGCAGRGRQCRLPHSGKAVRRGDCVVHAPRGGQGPARGTNQAVGGACPPGLELRGRATWPPSTESEGPRPAGFGNRQDSPGTARIGLPVKIVPRMLGGTVRRPQSTLKQPVAARCPATDTTAVKVHLGSLP